MIGHAVTIHKCYVFLLAISNIICPQMSHILFGSYQYYFSTNVTTFVVGQTIICQSFNNLTATLNGAILDGAILNGAFPNGAILNGAILNGAILDGAILNDNVPL